MNVTPTSSQTPRWLHYLAFVTAACCFFLLFLGGLVTSNQAGLSVPDWPTSYGWNMFTFPVKNWIGGIFFEHTHRLFASFVGFLIMAQAGLLQWKEPRKWVKRLGWFAFGCVVLQGVLGGVTVLMYLPPTVSSAHAALGQSVFCITLGIAMVTGKRWGDNIVKREERSRIALRTLSLTTVVIVFTQLVVGAFMRHTFSGLAIPTFPFTADGGFVPAFSAVGIVLNFLHTRVGAFLVTVSMFATARQVFRFHMKDRRIFVAMLIGIFLLGVQIMLGAITIWTAKAVTPTTLHVSCGAAILGTMTYIMVMSRHLYAKRAPKVEAGLAVSAA